MSATDGVNTPAVLTPFPDQVPPAGVKPVKVNAAELAQVERLPPAVTVGSALTVTVVWPLPEQPD